MFKVRQRIQSLFFALFFSLLGLMGGYLLFADSADHVSRKPESNTLIEVGEDGISGNDTTTLLEGMNRVVEGRSFYSLCGHWEPLNLENYHHVTSESLLDTFPASRGWSIEDLGDKLLITKNIKGLCPADENKKHLGKFGDFVAVVKGPVGVNGGIIEVTNIKLSNLPEDFRQQAESGTLDFPDGQSLLEALDSLDEYLE